MIFLICTIMTEQQDILNNTSNIPVPASPKATGAAGVFFEQHVGAFFLGLLLTKGIPPCFTDAYVSEVHFQTKNKGWNTDDILIKVQDAESHLLLFLTNVYNNDQRLYILQIRASKMTIQITRWDMSRDTGPCLWGYSIRDSQTKQVYGTGNASVLDRHYLLYVTSLMLGQKCLFGVVDLDKKPQAEKRLHKKVYESAEMISRMKKTTLEDLSEYP
jgi:hypothetical protein